jgi:hypothetical protein
MFSPRILAIVSLIWLFGTLLGSTFNYSNSEATWAGSDTTHSFTKGDYGQITDLQYVMNIKNAFQSVTILGTIPLPIPNMNYFKVIWNIMLMRFSFLVSNPYGELFWYFFLMPFALIGMVGLVLTFMSIVRGNFSWG